MCSFATETQCPRYVRLSLNLRHDLAAPRTLKKGVGIVAESCDLPTSACTNEYRDVQ